MYSGEGWFYFFFSSDQDGRWATRVGTRLQISDHEVSSTQGKEVWCITG